MSREEIEDNRETFKGSLTGDSTDYWALEKEVRINYLFSADIDLLVRRWHKCKAIWEKE